MCQFAHKLDLLWKLVLIWLGPANLSFIPGHRTAMATENLVRYQVQTTPALHSVICSYIRQIEWDHHSPSHPLRSSQSRKEAPKPNSWPRPVSNSARGLIECLSAPAKEPIFQVRSSSLGKLKIFLPTLFLRSELGNKKINTCKRCEGRPPTPSRRLGGGGTRV